MRDSLGFRMPCVPPEPGAETPTVSVLNRELAIFKPLTDGGLSIEREREAGADE